MAVPYATHVHHAMTLEQYRAIEPTLTRPLTDDPIQRRRSRVLGDLLTPTLDPDDLTLLTDPTATPDIAEGFAA
jgi:hypothetical protein